VEVVVAPPIPISAPTATEASEPVEERPQLFITTISLAPPPFEEIVDGARTLALEGASGGTFSGARAWVPRGHQLDPQDGRIIFRELEWLAVDVKKAENGRVFFENTLGSQRRLEAVPAFFALPTSKKLPKKGTIVRCTGFAAPGRLATAELSAGVLVVGRFEGEKDGGPLCLSEARGFVQAPADGVWPFPTKLEPGAVVDVLDSGNSTVAGEVYGLTGEEVWVRPFALEARKRAGAPLLKFRKADVKLLKLSLSKPWKVGDKVLTVSEAGPWIGATVTEVIRGGLSYRFEGLNEVRFPHQVARR
jgi:hypothetical protein